MNTPEKNGNPRIFKVTSKLIEMLNALPKTSQRVFGDGTIYHRKGPFYSTRKRVANKLKNPRLLEISFHTLRHWKATMLYHQTKDPIYVKEFLGHRKRDTTMLYIQLAEALFKDATDDFTVKVARSTEETTRLLENGFEYEKSHIFYTCHNSWYV